MSMRAATEKGLVGRGAAALRALGMRFGWGSGLRVRGGTVGGNWFAQAMSSALGLDGLGGETDWDALAGDPLENAVVALCLGWIGDNIVEPELRVRDVHGAPVEGNALEALLGQPNPAYDWDGLFAATAMMYAGHGNAYWLLARDRAKRLREVWWVAPWEIEPRGTPEKFLTHYVRRVGGGTEELAPEDVLHFKFGVDPRNPRLGLSRLRSVKREIYTDNQAATFMAALLKNMGIAPIMISPKDTEAVITPGDAEALQKGWLERFTGMNRGKPFVPSLAVNVDRLALTPEDLVLDRVRQFPEARICGALRIPALVVGLNVGDQTRTYANYRQARRAAYEDCLMPMARRLARAMRYRLLLEVGMDPERYEVGWDYSGVAALSDDLSDVFRRNNLGVGGRWMTINEARERAGLERDPQGDRYLPDPRTERQPSATASG